MIANGAGRAYFVARNVVMGRPRRPLKRGAAAQGGSSAQAEVNTTALPPLTVLTFATAAYVRWLERLHTNLRLLALPAVSLSVCAGDRVSQQAARHMSLTTLNFSLDLGHEQGGAGEHYGTGRYIQIVQAKSACIHAQLVSLEPSSLLWFVDGDVTLFGDPRPSFLSLGVDLALMADNIPGNTRTDNRKSCKACIRGSARECFAGRNNFNSGFFMARPVASTRWFWRTMLSYHAGRPEVRQQAALNELIRNYGWWQDEDRQTLLRLWTSEVWNSKRWSSTTGVQNSASRVWELRELGLEFSAERPPRPVTIAALDESRFLNGYCFYERRPLRKHGLGSSRVLAVHHNYIDGDELKFWRAQVFEAVVQTNDTMQTFLRRARVAMDTLSSWRAPCPRPRCSGYRSNISIAEVRERGFLRNRTGFPHIYWSSPRELP